MGPWESTTFSYTGSNPRTSHGTSRTRAARWGLSDWT